MTAANHVLAGAILATVFKQPAVALPLSLLSHFAMDALPHFGFKNYEERIENNKLFNFILITDGLLLFCVLIWLLLTTPGWLVFACGLLAASPDTVWVYRFVMKERFGRFKPPKGNWLTRFHAAIQKLEFKNGILIEYLVLMLFIWILSSRI